MSYQALEAAVVARLAAVIGSAADVEARPETDDQAANPATKTRVTVCYTASEFSDSIVRGYPQIMSTDKAYQYEFAELVIVLRSRLLRGTGQGYDIISKVYAALLGWVPAGGWHRTYLKVAEVEKNADGRWSWTISVVTRRPIIQAFEDDETIYPTLVDGQFNIDAV